MENCGIDNELPENPFLFSCPAGTLKALSGIPVLLWHPDKELKFDGKQKLIHNNQGIYHELKWKQSTGELALSKRREDIERHNVPRAVGATTEPETKRVFGRLRQASSRSHCCKFITTKPGFTLNFHYIKTRVRIARGIVATFEF